MIRVIVEKQNENIVAFHIQGHSGYAESGADIVCAAVSALAINCINSLEQLTEEAFVVEQEEEKGLLIFRLDDIPSEKAEVLLESLLLGVREISNQYGKQYVTVEIVRRK